MSETNKSMTLDPQSTTMHKLTHWHKALFERLGWIVLMKAKDKMYKVESYKKEIYSYLKMIEHLINEYLIMPNTEKAIHDLHVLEMEIKHLQKYVNKFI